jgi:hypothetical protein
MHWLNIFLWHLKQFGNYEIPSSEINSSFFQQSTLYRNVWRGVPWSLCREIRSVQVKQLKMLLRLYGTSATMIQCHLTELLKSSHSTQINSTIVSLKRKIRAVIVLILHLFFSAGQDECTVVAYSLAFHWIRLCSSSLPDS